MKLPDPLSLRHPDAASVKASVDLVNYIAQFTRLRLGGRQYVGLCPLPGHRERHPSFQVDATRQIFYCHGCQRGGDVFSFVMYQRGCGFSDAVREVVRFILGEVTAPKARPAPPTAPRSASWAQRRDEPKPALFCPEPRPPLPPCFFDAADLAAEAVVSMLVQRRITGFLKG
jgi:hypothetical protein